MPGMGRRAAFTTRPGGEVAEMSDHPDRAGAGDEFPDRGLRQTELVQEARLEEEFQNFDHLQEPCAARGAAPEYGPIKARGVVELTRKGFAQEDLV